ncbi:hypothetical protein RCL_jg28479.t1 [Rhizophagus clarus]|uniref:Uncharacterized protein n=1 Tax=Rhizophagus clarus TaxID=94130 RepID=A0A8H3KYJ9_9GLOM|nr:hypothetical protein RCL_jg28479.t1 [Rhizophagus clarus]
MILCIAGQLSSQDEIQQSRLFRTTHFHQKINTPKPEYSLFGNQDKIDEAILRINIDRIKNSGMTMKRNRQRRVANPIIDYV